MLSKFWLHLTLISVIYAQQNPPNILLILADDLGRNDVSYHGSNQIPTPNIDALAYNGIILNRFYTQSMCTPSRAALLTGQYPIRYGLQGVPILSGENRCLPLNMTILPHKLKELGYSTKLIGKWHLGFSYKNCTPTYRGFDYHFGYWTGLINYYDHFNSEYYSGFDMHENLSATWNVQNEYSTHLFTRKAQSIIKQYDYKKPLFLMISHLAVHTGNPGKIFEVPDFTENNNTFSYIANDDRRLFAGVLTELDKSVGNVVKALRDKGVLDNTIIVFLSDNGAQNWGIYDNSGSNWPLRGMKGTLFEGGVRSTAIIYYAKLKNKATINNQLMHITDLMPTLYTAAGGNILDLGVIDGINQWSTISEGTKSARSSLLLDIDEIDPYAALIGYNGHFKLVNDSVLDGYAVDGYFGQDTSSECNPSYNMQSVLTSLTNRAIDRGLTQNTILHIRNQLIINCTHIDVNSNSCDKNMCLYDLENDPCETKNLVKKYPHIVLKLSENLQLYWKQLKSQEAHVHQPESNPTYFNNTWSNWMEKL